MSRFSVPAALLAFLGLLVLSVPPARAAWGPPVYSGGSASGDAPPVPTGFMMESDGWGGGATCYAAGGTPHATGTATASGTITARFTWDNGGNPANTPPARMIVKETCKVSAYGNWYGPPGESYSLSGSATNGLGTPPIRNEVAPAFPQGADFRETADGTRLRTVNSSSGVIEVSASVNATFTGSAPGQGGSAGGVSVVYNAALRDVHAHPVNFRQTGAFPDSAFAGGSMVSSPGSIYFT